MKRNNISDVGKLNEFLPVGIARSGKGELENRASMIISDSKELYRSSKETLEKRGYEVVLLRLDDSQRNPLQLNINQHKKENL